MYDYRNESRHTGMTWRYTVFRNELRVMPLEKASCRKKKRHAARKSVIPQEKASCRKTKRHAARKSVMSHVQPQESVTVHVCDVPLHRLSKWASRRVRQRVMSQEKRVTSHMKYRNTSRHTHKCGMSRIRMSHVAPLNGPCHEYGHVTTHMLMHHFISYSVAVGESATYCTTLQCTATHCNTLRHAATCHRP